MTLKEYLLEQPYEQIALLWFEEERISIKEYLEYATTLQQLGGTIDLQKLKELTKFDILADDVKDVWKPTIKDEK